MLLNFSYHYGWDFNEIKKKKKNKNWSETNCCDEQPELLSHYRPLILILESKYGYQLFRKSQVKFTGDQVSSAYYFPETTRPVQVYLQVVNTF